MKKPHDRQHFIQRALLKFFSEDQKTIWMLDKRHQSIMGAYIKSVAFANNFLNKEIDVRFITPLENACIDKIENIIKLNYLTTTKQKEEDEALVDYAPLFVYTSLQLLRTPKLRGSLRKKFTVHSKWIFKKDSQQYLSSKYSIQIAWSWNFNFFDSKN